MRHSYDNLNAKRPTNLTVNSELLDVAKKLKINISATLEEALVRKVQQEKTEVWLAENQAAIGQYNKFIEENGVFSDGLRTF